MRIFHGSSIIAMTATERAAGRYMRAEDHSASTGGAAAAPAAEGMTAAQEMDTYSGSEINDPAPKPEGDNGAAFTGEGGEAAAGEGGEGGEAAGAAAGEGGEAAAGEGDGKSAAEAPKNPDADGELEKARREAEYWRGVAEGRKTGGEEKPADPAGQATDDPLGKEPDPKDYEYGDADARYIADLAAHEARKAVRQEQEAARITERLNVVENGWQERTTQAETVYPDFKEKVIAGGDKGSWACSQIMALAIKTSAAGADMAYHLASNPEESSRIAGMSPLEQAKEMGRLEYRFEAEARAKAEAASRDGGQNGGNGKGEVSDKGDSQAKQPTKVSAAPPPPPRVRGAGGKFAVDGGTDDFRAFEAHADQVLETKAQRRR